MTQLSARLETVANEIANETHIDIGSDHALLAKHLLESGRVAKVIAVEKHHAPYLRSKESLQGLNADVRFGDGLAVIEKNEADSLSICGMGAERMIKILSSHPERLPKKLILQANDKPELLRKWALNHYALSHEQLIKGHWLYSILSFNRNASKDKSYDGLDEACALQFGPTLLKQQHPLLKQSLVEQKQYYQMKISQNPKWNKDYYQLIQKALSYYE